MGVVLVVIDFDKLVLDPCMHSFGRPILYQYQSGQSIEVYGIFDKVTRFLEPVSGLDAGNSGIAATRLVVGVRLSDFSQKPCMDDRIVIDHYTFRVVEVHVDGQGGAHLVLNQIEDENGGFI